MHLQTIRPRDSSLDTFLPPVKQLRLDTTVDASTSLQSQCQSAPWYECASYIEVQDAIANGIAPSQIIYTNIDSSPASLRRAAKAGVEFVAIDSCEDLFKIRMHHPQAKILLRINAGDASSPASAFEYAIAMANELLEEAASFQLCIFSVSFNVNSTELAACGQVIESSSHLVEKMAALERTLAALAITVHLTSNDCVTRTKACLPESPLAFPDFADSQFTRNTLPLVS